MEYLNDYNDNAKIMKINFVFEVYVNPFIFMKMWKQMFIRRFSGIHYIMHMCWSLSFFYFDDIYTNYVMESLNVFDIKASLASRSRIPGLSSPWLNRKGATLFHRSQSHYGNSLVLTPKCLFLLSNKYNNAM